MYELSDGVLNLGDEKTSQYVFAPCPKAEALETYLESLANEDVLLIAAVMYGGRDFLSFGRAQPLDDMIEKFCEEGSHSLVASIAEKAPLAEYLAAGIEAYTAHGN